MPAEPLKVIVELNETQMIEIRSSIDAVVVENGRLRALIVEFADARDVYAGTYAGSDVRRAAWKRSGDAVGVLIEEARRG